MPLYAHSRVNAKSLAWLGMTEFVLLRTKMILLDFDHYKPIGRDFQGKLALLDFALFGSLQFRGLADLF